MEHAIKLLGGISALVALIALAVAAWHTWRYEWHCHHRERDR